MQLDDTSRSGALHLLGYGPGRFQFTGDKIVMGSILLMPDGPQSWPITDVAALTQADVDRIAAYKDRFDILLFGCGAAIAPLPKQVRLGFEAAGIAYDLMDTGAACRAFNVLLAERRRICAALIALPDD